MGELEQMEIAERHAVDSLASQISGLGYATMQCLQGLPCKDVEAGVWRMRAETLALAFQAYCRGICNQMATESPLVDGGLHTAIFQLGAIGDYAIFYLKPLQIQMQGGMDNQRLHVSQTAISIQNACDSIAAMIEREGKADE
jgi:hypothetical protein